MVWQCCVVCCATLWKCLCVVCCSAFGGAFGRISLSFRCPFTVFHGLIVLQLHKHTHTTRSPNHLGAVVCSRTVPLPVAAAGGRAQVRRRGRPELSAGRRAHHPLPGTAVHAVCCAKLVSPAAKAPSAPAPAPPAAPAPAPVCLFRRRTRTHRPRRRSMHRRPSAATAPPTPAAAPAPTPALLASPPPPAAAGPGLPRAALRAFAARAERQ